MVGRLPKIFYSPDINAGIFGLKVFIHCVILTNCFLHRFGAVDLLFDSRSGIGVGIRSGRVIHFLLDYLEVTIIRRLRIKFIKLISLHLDPIEYLFPVILLIIEAFSNHFMVRNDATKLLLCILRIIVGALRLGGVLGAVLGLRHTSSLI